MLCDYLRRYEEAIASFDRAIQIKPDYHYALHNRGIAAGNSWKYNPEVAILLKVKFPTLSQILPDPTLTKHGYEGELLSYETGLKHCPQETHPEGWGLLHQYTGNAHYFQGKEKPNYREYWHKAVAEYKLSLITLTPEAYPEFHLKVLQNLLRVLWGLGKETEAKEWRRKGLDVFGKLLNRPMSRYQEWELRAKFITFSRIRVDVLVEEGDFIRALEAAERDKNFYLAWILDGQKGDIRSPSYENMRQLTNPTTAIIYWYVSDFALTTFIIKHGMREPIVIQPLPSPPLRGEGARESLSNSSFPMAQSGVGAKDLGEVLSEKPEDNNPWTIPEEASSLFTSYFYWQLRHGKEPAIALKITQKWLRTLTHRKLERYYKVIFAKLPKEEKPLRPHLRGELLKISKNDKTHQNPPNARHHNIPHHQPLLLISRNKINH